jgi:uncharacterized OsmC-like protein
MNSKEISNSIRLWTEQPETAKMQPVVEAYSEGSKAVMQAGPFKWSSDFPPSLGGTNEAPSPILHMLGALASCAVLLIKDTLAPQYGVDIDNVKATATCEADGRGAFAIKGGVPDLSNIGIHIEIQSQGAKEEVERLYQAWQDRCGIYLSLIKSLDVKVTLDVKSS